LGVGGLGVRGLGVEGLGVGGLDVGVERVSSRHRGLSRAIALHVAKSVGRPLRYSAILSVRPKLIPGRPIGHWVSLISIEQHNLFEPITCENTKSPLFNFVVK
jgi:hypothetical protein